MSRYFYVARDNQNGNLVKGSMVVTTKLEVINYLKKEQYLIIAIHNNDIYSIKELVKSLWKRQNISTKQIIILCQQLSIMLAAGLEIIDALKLINNNLSDKHFNYFITKTIDGLNVGESLADIWQREFTLPRYLINSINVAEHTGLLAKALNDAKRFLSKQYALKRKIEQIMVYPLFLLMVLLIVVSLIIGIVIPAFADIFQRLDIPLPWLTQMILNLGLNFRVYLWKISIFIIVCIVGFSFFGRKDNIRLSLFKCSLNLPIIGRFICKLHLLKFLYQLVFLLNSGISIGDSLEIILQGENNILVQDSLKQVYKLINQGCSLASAFAKVPLNIDILQEFMIIGEQTGMLAKILTYLIIFWEEEIDNVIKLFTQLLEPILMMVVGSIIGIFVLAIILPLLDLVANIGM